MKFAVIFLLRYLLLVIPGIIYLINNQYCTFAYILRGQKGKAAFDYSQTIVEENRSKVFVLLLLKIFISAPLTNMIDSFISIFLPLFWSNLLTVTLSLFIASGIDMGNVLLFFNLEFQKNN